MQQAGYHYANNLAQQLKSDIQQRDSDILTYIQSAIEFSSPSDTGSLPSTMTPSDVSTMTSAEHKANTMKSDTVQLEMLKILQQIQQNLTTTGGQQGTGNNNSNNNNGRRGRAPRKTPDNCSFTRTIKDKYYWTHGGCNHTSTECWAKANGHQDSATFKNRQGGSNAFCPVA